METFSQIQNQIPLDQSPSIIGFATADQMQQYYLQNSEKVWAGVSFYLL